MKSIVDSAKSYEEWLSKEIGEAFYWPDIDEKRKKMKRDPFTFLRATYWRWAEIIPGQLPELSDTPPILAVGDIHLENFGTWRDVDGRMIWGVNDFDEAAIMPYAHDLVRLAASALLARQDHEMKAAEICDSILSGYKDGIASPRPFVLERKHKWLRKLLLISEDDRKEFWEKFDDLSPENPPDDFRTALHDAMPDPTLELVISRRTAGTGSLGRPRYVARTEWRGGDVVREAKALVVSAWSKKHRPDDQRIYGGVVASGRYRSTDPWYRVTDRIVVRRLAPNSRKIEVKHDASKLLTADMLNSMGFELANCHAGDAQGIAAVRSDADKRDSEWLRELAKKAADIIEEEYEEWVGSNN